MRLIDADELMKKVKKWLPPDPCGREEKEFPFETDICVSMLMEIEEAPTVDASPTRLGEWLDGYKMQTCSLCKCRGKKSWTFCPHCGARMIYDERKEKKHVDVDS